MAFARTVGNPLILLASPSEETRLTSAFAAVGIIFRQLQGTDARFDRRDVSAYFSDKAEQKGVALSELLTEVLKRDIEISEALR
jgi:hypothetical protein